MNLRFSSSRRRVQGVEEEEEEEEDLWTRMMTTPDAGLVNTEIRRGDLLTTQVYEELVYLSLSFNRKGGSGWWI